MSFCQQVGDYIVHTIKPGEVPAVLAKKYNVSLPELASLNKWGAKVVLHVGDKVKLPLGAHLSPVTDSVAKALAVVAAPVKNDADDEKEGRSAPVSPVIEPHIQPAADTSRYVLHTIEKGEIPSVLAKKYGVNVDELKRINNWNIKTVWHVGDKVKLPRNVHTAITVDAATTVTKPLPAEKTPAVVKAPVTDSTTAPTAVTPPAQTSYVVQKKETLYSISKKFKVTVVQLKNWNRLVDNNISEGQTLVLFPADNYLPPATQTTAVTAPPSNGAQAAPAVKQSTPVIQAATPVVHKPAVDSAKAPIPAEGYFTALFGKDVAGRALNTATGMAMTFKTASGWTDKKYYVLMNDVPPGSIVKITNAEGKSVYAKILWNMGDPQDNEGLNFRISDAAAAVLGLKELKFQVTVSYYK